MGISLRRRATPAGNESPNHQDNHRADHCSNQASAFARAIPADRWPKSGQKSAYYPENCGEDENPDGSFSPGVMNFAITPAIDPMMIVQMMCMANTLNVTQLI